MLKSNLSARVFQVLIDLIPNDLWCVVVLHGGTTYLAVLALLLDNLVYLVVFLSRKPWFNPVERTLKFSNVFYVFFPVLILFSFLYSFLS